MHYYVSIYGTKSLIKFFPPITEVFISFKTNLEPQITMWYDQYWPQLIQKLQGKIFY